MKKKSKVTTDLVEPVLSQIERLGKKQVMVGIPSDKATRNDSPKASNAVIGYIMEFGGHIANPGGTPYITDAIVKGKFVGTRFVSKSFEGKTNYTKAHYIDIPARPFLIPGVETAHDKIAELMKQTLIATFKDPKKKNVYIDQGLNKVGMAASMAVRRYITNGNFEPLKASTLAARRRRGRTGTKPLIDSSQMRNSVTYVLRSI